MSPFSFRQMTSRSRLRISPAATGESTQAIPGGGATSNIVIRSVNVDTNAASPGHGVYVGKVANAVIDRVAVADAQVNGILIDNGSSNAIVTGCTVGTTGGPDSAIKINNSASAYVVGNTVQNTGANAHGILLSKSPNSTVTGNFIVRANANGILADSASDNSVITNNTIQATTTQHGIAVKNSAGVTRSRQHYQRLRFSRHPAHRRTE